ncbi:hypothetical protein [Thiolapillus sp.]|uniref:hypothetical protein n=1 Tax=Thiolapillus sp. TaxID=2017437 RepID=UPI003AF8A7CA
MSSIDKELKRELSKLSQYAYCDCGDSAEPGALLATLESPYTDVEIFNSYENPPFWCIEARQRFDFKPINPICVRTHLVRKDQCIAMRDDRGTPREVYEVITKVIPWLSEPLVVKPISAPEGLRFDVHVMRRSLLPASREKPHDDPLDPVNDFRIERVMIRASSIGEYACMEEACYRIEKMLAVSGMPYRSVTLPKLGCSTYKNDFYVDYEVEYDCEIKY